MVRLLERPLRPLELPLTGRCPSLSGARDDYTPQQCRNLHDPRPAIPGRPRRRPPASLAQGFTGFDDFLKLYEAAKPAARPELARSFVEWQRGRGGFPIVQEDGGAVFFYLGTGAEQEVRVGGDFHPRSFFNLYWDKAGQPLTRSGAVFYRRYPFEPDARLASWPCCRRSARTRSLYVHQGHSFGSWREAAVEMLKYSFG